MSNVKVTNDQIRDIIANSKIEVTKWGDKTTIVKAQLPNGFIIVESSSCVDPENFDEVIGYDICMDRIVNKVWELEGYALQKEVAKKKSDLKGLAEYDQA
jgi:hypothetical protein